MSELTGLTTLLSEVDTVVTKQIESKIDETVKEIKKQIDDIKKYQPTIVVNGNTETKIEGLKHKQLNQLVTVVGLAHNVILVGSAGSGKTKAAEQVSEALGFEFYCMSVGAQTTKSDIVGYMDANGKYVPTHFRKAYENGGVFVMDEIDAGNSNVLIILNSALANGVMSFPDAMIKRHKDFRFVATANTYGNGADRQYVGRNQLDSATLDRFTTLDWQIDEGLEADIVGGLKQGKSWQSAVASLRKHISDSGIRAIVSPRATVKGAELLEVDIPVKEVVEMVILPQIPADNRVDIKEYILEIFKPAEVKTEVKATTGNPQSDMFKL